MTRAIAIDIDHGALVSRPTGRTTAPATGSRTEQSANANQQTGPRRAAGPLPGADESTPFFSPAEVREYVDELNEKLQKRLQGIHDVNLVVPEDDRTDLVIQVLEKESGNLIIQFPPEMLRRLGDQLEEIVGALLDRRS